MDRQRQEDDTQRWGLLSHRARKLAFVRLAPVLMLRAPWHLSSFSGPSEVDLRMLGLAQPCCLGYLL